VQAWTELVLSEPAATSAPAALTASAAPHAPGSWTGGDHAVSACAGEASAGPAPTALSTAGSTRPQRRIEKKMASPYPRRDRSRPTGRPDRRQVPREQAVQPAKARGEQDRCR